MYRVYFLLPDTSTTIIRVADAAHRVQVDIYDLDLIRIDLLSEVKILVIASDHLKFHDGLVIELDTVSLLLVLIAIIADLSS